MSRHRYHFGTDRKILINGLLITFIAILIAAGVRLRSCRSPQQAQEAGFTPVPMTVDNPVQVRVYDHETDKILTMELEDYICHVVAAEMPASYESEALKAQAVAARTLAVKALTGGSRGCTEGADLCTSSEHCQAYDSEEACRDKWGTDYDLWWGRVTQAVYETAGIIMTYEGEPIEVFYHAVSGGQTEDVENVFSEALPYLRSVESGGEENASHYEQDIGFTREEAEEKLETYFSGLRLSADTLSDEIRILGRYDSGRVSRIQLGDRVVEGVDIRRALGLPSTQFTIAYTPTRIVFHCIGYGHGVGMSQAGANVMAGNGSDYRDILSHYYTGVTLEPMGELS